MRKSKRQTLRVIRQLLLKPKWWNETFARYDQKRLHSWANKVQSEMREQMLRPRAPKLIPEDTDIHERLLLRELYKPYIIKNKVTGVTTL
jgi:hypothetical protein